MKEDKTQQEKIGKFQKKKKMKIRGSRIKIKQVWKQIEFRKGASRPVGN